MKLTESKNQMGRFRRLATLGACAMLGVGAVSTMVALRFDVAAAATDGAGEQKPEPRSLPAETMQKHILTKVPPQYPADAKKARIQGKVVLDAIIGKTGNVENLKVVSGPAELQQSALDAVRQWTYRPVLLNGEPVEVKTTVTVIYTLAK